MNKVNLVKTVHKMNLNELAGQNLSSEFSINEDDVNFRMYFTKFKKKKINYFHFYFKTDKIQ